jgi:hypothetical protein
MKLATGNNDDYIEGIRGELVQPSPGQPQHTITVTLTSPAPGQGANVVHGQGPGGPSGGGGGGPGGGPSSSSLIVSNMPAGVGPPGSIGICSVSSAAVHPSHGGQVGIHYSGSAISATPMQANIQPKVISICYNKYV